MFSHLGHCVWRGLENFLYNSKFRKINGLALKLNLPRIVFFARRFDAFLNVSTAVVGSADIPQVG
jgi:hypothetical protein